MQLSQAAHKSRPSLVGVGVLVGHHDLCAAGGGGRARGSRTLGGLTAAQCRLLPPSAGGPQGTPLSCMAATQWGAATVHCIRNEARWVEAEFAAGQCTADLRALLVACCPVSRGLSVPAHLNVITRLTCSHARNTPSLASVVPQLSNTMPVAAFSSLGTTAKGRARLAVRSQGQWAPQVRRAHGLLSGLLTSRGRSCRRCLLQTCSTAAPRRASSNMTRSSTSPARPPMAW